MFPYPSGTLHLGHLRVYTISDVLARFKHLQGYDVLHPIGWDAFGLPAENAAIERGQHPEKWTLKNIETMKQQMMAMGGWWDWSREFRTCDPAFYKHTQAIFLRLHERGLAYQAESLVNFDPVDKTVLANEQVDANGCSWRSGAKVEKVMLKQWFLKIRQFQDQLLDDLDVLAENKHWPERVLAMQRNWLGRSEGVKFCFSVERFDEDKSTFGPMDSISVMTTRPDTLFAVMYVALSPNHPFVRAAAKTDAALRDFLQRAQHLPPDSKEGYELEGVYAINPADDIMGYHDFPQRNGRVPVYVAPYVLDYGYGAVMGVPAHDSRDHAFWRANSEEPFIHPLITQHRGYEPGYFLPLEPDYADDEADTEKGFLSTEIPGYHDLSSDDAAEKIIGDLQKQNKVAERVVNWRLRDWLISRQRYWGTPIPIIHCGSCGPVPVPEQDLPVELPDLPDSYFKGKTGNPLAEDVEWKKTTCPSCGSPAERETDTMDTFMDSSWYFFRFLDAKNRDAPVDARLVNPGMPVEIYLGGVEHAILHLLYARFISKFFASTEWWPNGQRTAKGEPFKKLITQGMVHGKTYSDPKTGRFLRPDEVQVTKDTVRIKESGLEPKMTFEKMSKSKYNGVDPGTTIAKYGADVTRAHMLFQAPVSDVLEWDEKSIIGVERWLTRVIRLSTGSFLSTSVWETLDSHLTLDQTLVEILASLKENNIPTTTPPPTTQSAPSLIPSLPQPDRALWSKLQQTIASVTKSYAETYSLNTIVSDLMTLTNLISDTSPASEFTPYLQYHATTHLLRMLAPIAPATAEEGWELLRAKKNRVQTAKHDSIFAAGFPKAELDILPQLNSTQPCVVQVDGKKRFEVEIGRPGELRREEMEAFLLGELGGTEVGREWLERGKGKIWRIAGEGEEGEGKGEGGLPRGWKMIVVRGGRIVNFVSPRKG
ncbi:leucyl-tRNA synthetase [Polyplosphaeria fusca]|uniref:leucine--tRNA ligase n=1 Tax=Polyplosphaeria fusca TaxID=682080 RepID=A0A9P4UWH9_9PLEO|nr:leucyl-tRNA synthetase [Polyplosphaeria fusca]